MNPCKNGCGEMARTGYDGFCSWECKGGFQMRAYRALDADYAKQKQQRNLIE